MKKTIDHPYLLPPSSDTIQARSMTGKLWSVRGRDSVLCGENGYPMHDDYETYDAYHVHMNDWNIKYIKGHFNR